MAQSDFNDAFNECIDRLNAGQSVDDCLRAYPAYAADLRPLLEAGLTVPRAQADPFTVAQAQRRGRGRVLAAYDQAMAPRRRVSSLLARPGWAFVAAAALVFVLAVVIVANRPPQDVVPLDQPTASVTPLALTDTATATETGTATATASATTTGTATTTATSTETATATATPTTAPTDPAACAPARPDGWVTYRVQSGDTLSLLAAATGTTVEELMRVNCIEDARLLRVDQALFLPLTPDLPDEATPPPTQPPGGGDDGNDNEGGGVDDGGGNDNSDDDGSGDDDDDNSNDNHDDDEDDDDEPDEADD